MHDIVIMLLFNAEKLRAANISIYTLTYKVIILAIEGNQYI